jgi:hypothetical protein
MYFYLDFNFKTICVNVLQKTTPETCEPLSDLSEDPASIESVLSPPKINFLFSKDEEGRFQCLHQGKTTLKSILNIQTLRGAVVAERSNSSNSGID